MSSASTINDLYLGAARNKYQDPTLVRTLVERIITLLAFCIDPCWPCEILLPTLEKLALLYASNAKLEGQVTIGKINIDENDIPDSGIQGFPTMKLYPAGAKDAPVFYPGTRTLKDLADFIRDHGTNKA